jgi:agmatinase
MGGNRFGPQLIRIAGENIESFSPYFQKSLMEFHIHDAGDLILNYASVKQTFRQIRKVVQKYLKAQKKLLVLGGEHTITFPIIQEFVKVYPDLYLIQLDAHSDTRDTFCGEKFCHATVIKRISEILHPSRIFQLGLRSITENIGSPNQFLFSVLKYLDGVKREIGPKPCYLTLDVDVVDCGLFPAVQTPVPNGINFSELFNTIFEMRTINMVGSDLVEYSPLVAPNLTYASTMAEIVRELLLLLSHSGA